MANYYRNNEKLHKDHTFLKKMIHIELKELLRRVECFIRLVFESMKSNIRLQLAVLTAKSQSNTLSEWQVKNIRGSIAKCNRLINFLDMFDINDYLWHCDYAKIIFSITFELCSLRTSTEFILDDIIKSKIDERERQKTFVDDCLEKPWEHKEFQRDQLRICQKLTKQIKLLKALKEEAKHIK